MITETITVQLPTISRTATYSVTANAKGVVCRATLDGTTVEENLTRETTASQSLPWSEVTEDSLFRVRMQLCTALEFAK